MARKKRIEFDGAWYHVQVCGNGGRDLFTDEREKKKFCEYLGRACERFGARVHAYCLLPERYYLLLETPHANLSRFMQYLNASYTTYFNIKHQRVGHLVHGHYRAVIIEPAAYALSLSVFIHLVPVLECACIHPADYYGSSYPFYAGDRACPPYLETRYIYDLLTDPGAGLIDGQDASTSRAEQYEAYVQSARTAVHADPSRYAYKGLILGSDEFITKIGEETRKDHR